MSTLPCSTFFATAPRRRNLLITTCCDPLASEPARQRSSATLLHYEPLALLVTQVKLHHGCEFGCCTVPPLNIAEHLAAPSDQQCAPRAGRCPTGIAADCLWGTRR